MKINYDVLLKFCRELLLHAGLDEFSIDSVAAGLCEASLRGVDSHGVRLLPHYLETVFSGEVNPCPHFQISQIYPAVMHLDADHGFGHAAGMKAIECAVTTAVTEGLGCVAVSNSSHPGAMASMALRAARMGYLAFGFTHADALLISSNGTRPFFGTNPICFAAPREEEDPYCLDMATSIIPWNRVLFEKHNEGVLAPGTTADHRGEATTDPLQAKALFPMGDYKGYALSSMIEVLCGIYTGMNFGRDIAPMYQARTGLPRRLGQFYLVLKADGVVSHELFLSAMQRMSVQVRNEPASGEEPVMLPGDKEIKTAKYRKKYGITLDNITVQSLVTLSRKLGVTFPKS